MRWPKNSLLLDSEPLFDSSVFITAAHYRPYRNLLSAAASRGVLLFSSVITMELYAGFRINVGFDGASHENMNSLAIMRLSCWILVCQLFLSPRLAFAETFDLVCVHREYNMTLNFRIDTLKNTIIHNGILAREVYIDKTTISFIVDLMPGAYFHYVSRGSGNMTVRAPDGTLIYGHECATGKEKL